MRLEYDPRGDIACIYVSEDVNATVDHTERVGNSDEYERSIDYDANGEIVGYEFMNASNGLALDRLPHRHKITEFIASVTSLHVVQRAS
jgi:uncharacterized protein YuzE